MAIRFSIKQSFGDPIYLKSDPQQTAHDLVGIRLLPGEGVVYTLSTGYEDFEVYSFQCSFERDEALRLSYSPGED